MCGRLSRIVLLTAIAFLLVVATLWFVPKILKRRINPPMTDGPYVQNVPSFREIERRRTAVDSMFELKLVELLRSKRKTVPPDHVSRLFGTLASSSAIQRRFLLVVAEEALVKVSLDSLTVNQSSLHLVHDCLTETGNVVDFVVRPSSEAGTMAFALLLLENRSLQWDVSQGDPGSLTVHRLAIRDDGEIEFLNRWEYKAFGIWHIMAASKDLDEFILKLRVAPKIASYIYFRKDASDPIDVLQPCLAQSKANSPDVGFYIENIMLLKPGLVMFTLNSNKKVSFCAIDMMQTPPVVFGPASSPFIATHKVAFLEDTWLAETPDQVSVQSYENLLQSQPFGKCDLTSFSQLFSQMQVSHIHKLLGCVEHHWGTQYAVIVDVKTSNLVGAYPIGEPIYSSTPVQVDVGWSTDEAFFTMISCVDRGHLVVQIVDIKNSGGRKMPSKR